MLNAGIRIKFNSGKNSLIGNDISTTQMITHLGLGNIISNKSCVRIFACIDTGNLMQIIIITK